MIPPRRIDDSLQVAIHFGSTYIDTLDLPPATLRAYTVGSGRFADIRVESAHVAPIEFFLEREGDRIRLTRAYGDDTLKMSGCVVTRSQLLPYRSTVEIGSRRWHLEFGPPLAQRRSTSDEVSRDALDVTRVAGVDLEPDGDVRSSVADGPKLQLGETSSHPATDGATLVDQPIARSTRQHSTHLEAEPRLASRQPLPRFRLARLNRLASKPRILTIACAIVAAFVALLLAVITSSPGDGIASARTNAAAAVAQPAAHPNSQSAPTQPSDAGATRSAADSRSLDAGGAPASSAGDDDSADALPPSDDLDPLVTTAVEHLAAGRLEQARDAYTVLAARYAHRPAYAVVAKVLTRRRASRGKEP